MAAPVKKNTFHGLRVRGSFVAAAAWAKSMNFIQIGKIAEFNAADFFVFVIKKNFLQAIFFSHQ
jgi:hypothetical protein